jgi:hypothetical protein
MQNARPTGAIPKRPLTPKQKRANVEPTLSDVESLSKEAHNVIHKAVVAKATENVYPPERIHRRPLTPTKKIPSPQKPPAIVVYPSSDYRQSIPAKTGQLKRKELTSDEEMKLETFERQRELIASQIIYFKNKIPQLPLLQRDIREIEEKVKKSDHWKNKMSNTIPEPETRFLQSLRDPEFDEMLRKYRHVDAAQKDRSQKILNYMSQLDKSLEVTPQRTIFRLLSNKFMFF